jgi:tripeptidyl-peptidase-1
MISLNIWRWLLLVVLCCGFVAGNWKVQQRANPDSRIRLHIGLRMNDRQDELQRLASSISDPRQAPFRKHLTSEQLLEFVQAPEHVFADVKKWLYEAGIPKSDILLRGNVVEVMINVSTAETLLNTTYYEFADDEGTRLTRTKAYNLPEKLKDSVTFVSPTTILPPARKQRTLAQNPDSHVNKRQTSCGVNDQTTLGCIRQIYNITYTPKPNRTTFAVYATEAASYSSSDLQTFLKTYNPPAVDAEYTVVGSGNSSNGSPGIGGAFETALDTQTALGLAWPAQGVLYNLGGVFGPNIGVIYDPFVQFLQDLIYNDTVPSVVSFSESMPENQMDPDYAKSLCDMMMQVGTRGVTLLFSK